MPHLKGGHRTALDPASKWEELYIDKGGGTPGPIGTPQVPVPDGYAWKRTSTMYADNNSSEIIPWILVQRAEVPFAGWYAGIEFSGCTRLSLPRQGESLRGKVGLNPDLGPFRTRVDPGGNFVTPTIFLGGFVGGPDAAGNTLRRWERRVLANPLTLACPDYPLLVNNSWGSGMEVDEAMTKRMIGDSAELGFDMFHLDAGWFRGVGDWYPDAKKLPHGLAAIADEAHLHGLKFGLWVDWAQAGLDTNPGALNARDPKVRDWLIRDPTPDWKPEAFRGITIDLGVPAAEDWAQREVERLIDDYHLDMLEQDGYLVAKNCVRTDHPHAPPGRPQGQPRAVATASTNRIRRTSAITPFEPTTKSIPGCERKIRICCWRYVTTGGRMVDFGSAAHGDYFSITDTYDPLSNRRAFYDASHVLSAAMLECYVEKWPTPRIENFCYMIRSGMMGWLTIMLDTTQWTPEQHAVAKKEFNLYKTQLRPFIRDADLYHISPPLQSCSGWRRDLLPAEFPPHAAQLTRSIIDEFNFERPTTSKLVVCSHEKSSPGGSS